jgi:hypothetical protein
MIRGGIPMQAKPSIANDELNGGQPPKGPGPSLNLAGDIIHDCAFQPVL